MKKHTFVLFSVLSLLTPFSLSADVTIPNANTSEWRFDGSYDPVYGPGTLNVEGAAGTTDSFTTNNVGGQSAGVLQFTQRASNADGYTMLTGIDGSQDGGSDPTGVEQFTMILDMMFDDESQSFMGIWNGNANNANDSEFFIRPDTGGFWMPTTGSTAAGSLNVGEFNRIVFRNDWINDDTDVFVNGTLVIDSAASPDYVFDGSQNPYWFLTDNTPGETGSGQISAYAFTDVLLSDADIAALGGVSAAGIFSIPEPTHFMVLMGLGCCKFVRRRR